MIEINMHAEDISEDQAAAISASAATSVERGARGRRWPDSPLAILMGRVGRSGVSARRYWLRFLDAPFAKAFRNAGALSIDELTAAVPRILRCEEGRIGIATIEEWWEFAMRRRWLESVGTRWALTERAEGELRAERERISSPDPKSLADSVTRWVIPTGLVGAAGVASGKYLVLEAAILVVAGTAIVGLLLAAGMWGVLEPRMDRWFALRACDWLEGRRIWPVRGTNRGQSDFTRLYESASGDRL